MTVNAGPCCLCNADILLPNNLYAAAKHSEHISFWCPYGHQQHFTQGESDKQKLRRERDRLAQRIAERDVSSPAPLREILAVECDRRGLKFSAAYLRGDISAAPGALISGDVLDVVREALSRHPLPARAAGDAPFKFVCAVCGEVLTTPGGLAFSAPDSDGMVRKFHICAKHDIAELLHALSAMRDVPRGVRLVSGWKLVPEEPTEEMLKVGSKIIWGKETTVPDSRAARAYKAMVRARNLPCPICNGIEGCDHTRTERDEARLALLAASPPADNAT